MTKTKIYLVNSPDRGANGERTQAVFDFLKLHHYHPQIIDSEKLFQSSPEYLLFRLIQSVVYRTHSHLLASYLFLYKLKLRGQVINRYLQKIKPSIVILQYSEDIFYLKQHPSYQLIIDCPIIFSQEVKYNYRLCSSVVKQITQLEKKAYQSADYVCYNWYSYLKKDITNGFILNWGCSKQSLVAKHHQPQKIIYVGGVYSDWNNPKLIATIQKQSLYPLDIFSYDTNPNIKSLGYLTNKDHLSNYQFGLLTSSNDPHRNHGFSVKHLLYFSYGLPVLCPEWRQDPILDPGTIYYNETNFNQQVKKYSQKDLWQKKHLAALKIAQKYRWSKTLLPLLDKINSLENK